MPTSLVLVEGERLDDQSVMISLANAKQIVIGQAPDYGLVVHIAATTQSDLEAALHDIAVVEGVTGLIALAMRGVAP